MAETVLVRGLRDQLVNKLRADVLSGRYKEGDVIRQEEVVARYQVSRTPVREALIELENEGLLVHIPNRGTRVARQAPDSIHELLIPIRRTVETYALRLCYSTLTEIDFTRLDDILDRMRQACERGDYVALGQEDVAFHRFLVERAGEPALVKIWSTIVSQVRAYFRRSHLEYKDLMDVYREHAAIVETFRQGDEQAAIEYLASRIGDPASDAMFEDLLRLGGTRPAARSA